MLACPKQLHCSDSNEMLPTELLAIFYCDGHKSGFSITALQASLVLTELGEMQ